MGAFSGCRGGGKKECQNAGIIKIWISKQFPEFPNFIHEVREVCSEWNPLISLLLARKRWKVQVLTVSVLFLGECESNTRRKWTIPSPASWSIILGGRTEAGEQKPAFNTPLRQEGYFTGKTSAAKLGKIKIINVFSKAAQKGHPQTSSGQQHPCPRPLAHLTQWNMWTSPRPMEQTG